MDNLSVPTNLTDFSEVAVTATADVIRTYKTTTRYVFLARFENGMSNWRADHIKASIIAEKFASKIREVVLEKDEGIQEIKCEGGAEHSRMSVEDLAADQDQQEQWTLRTEQAAEGLKSARYWRSCIKQAIEELARIRVCWDNMWYLHELGFDETSESLKESCTGLLKRYLALMKIQQDAAAAELELCASMGVGSIVKLWVIDKRKSREAESSEQPTTQPDFVWESYRSGT